MNLNVEFRVLVKLTCGWLDRGERRNLHKRADRQTNRQTETELHCTLSWLKKGNEDEQIMLSVAHKPMAPMTFH